MSGSVAFGAHISEDRQHASVVTARRADSGKVLVNLMFYDSPRLVVAWLDGACAFADHVGVVVNPKSQSGTLIEPLRAAGIIPVEPDAEDMAVAHGEFLDLVARGGLELLGQQPLSDAVAAAMRTVERHLFVPNVSVEGAYRDDTVVTRRDGEGVATSSASAPWLVGLMLDQLEVGPGMRVLEIGGGTGYNAALIAELVGRRGTVTAVEIAPDVAEDARRALAEAGVTNVEVVCGDGEYGYPPNAPYDRIIVTAGHGRYQRRPIRWRRAASWSSRCA